ncbi:MAG: 4-hydroxy-tetrahydrodipicolinate synthase, partial [Solirubrobacterales bacterium]|nr:4-hydroxy-tetrahydrodipicolinate synthase [Solirubrobacterales bacterium]
METAVVTSAGEIVTRGTATFPTSAGTGVLDAQLAGGIAGLVPCGTTGESPTLTAAERDRLIELSVAAAAHAGGDARPTVLAGTGTNDTSHSVHLTKEAVQLGVDGVLAVTPYYNRPSQAGLTHHFTAVAEAAGDTPVILYDIEVR